MKTICIAINQETNFIFLHTKDVNNKLIHIHGVYSLLHDGGERTFPYKETMCFQRKKAIYIFSQFFCNKVIIKFYKILQKFFLGFMDKILSKSKNSQNN